MDPTPAPEPMLLDEERNRGIVDGLRASGILLVVLFHVMFGTSKVLQNHAESHGHTDGLDGFVANFPPVFNIAWQALGSEQIFLVSGFLLSYLLLRELRRTGRIDLRDYLVRRISRILPLYAIGLTIYALATFGQWRWWELGLNVVFASKLFGAETIIPVGWSLEAIIQVFLALPFLCAWIGRSRRPLTWALLLLVLSVVPRYLKLAAHPEDYAMPFHALVYGGDGTETQKDLYYLLLYRATPFLFGLLLALLAVDHGAALRRLFSGARGAVSVVVGLALMVVSGFQPLHDAQSFVYRFDVEYWLWFWTLQRAVFTVGVALVMLPVFHAARGLPGLLGTVLAWQAWKPVSRNIYSIYLFHFACMIPAAAVVLLPTRPDAWKVLVTEIDELDHAIGSVNNLEVVAIFALTSYLAVRVADWLTRKVELPSQAWIRARWGREAVRARQVAAGASRRCSE